MKTQGKLLIIASLTGAILLGCSKTDNPGAKVNLKQAVNKGAVNLNNAMNDITATQAYGIFTLSDGSLKSGTTDSTYRVYIPLDKIKGIYDYKPVAKHDRMGRSIIQYFNMSADNSLMVVRMPLSKVVNPKSLRHYSPGDTTLVNNFSITVSDYHNNYNSYHDFDYVLTSSISVDNAIAGNLDINSLVSPAHGIHYGSQYAFTDGYVAKYQYDSGDTTISSFTILGSDKVLYQEKLLTVKNDTARFGREHEYILTIGDVQIARNSGTKAVEVYLNGVLQPNATVTIVDKDDDGENEGDDDHEVSLCKKRDILITFEDGTTATVSDLIGQSIDDIKTLYKSLHQVFFAAYVVDWIAYDIYYQRN